MADEAANPKISVIVPVYKVEKYLRECVESVLTQNFEDFEIILVDDGSPDRCGEICDELAEQDSRIRVFHQENRGGIAARKFGVEQARGEWINFLDSDDLLPPNALKDLFDEATGDADWVNGKMQRFDDGETPEAETRTGEVKSFDLVGLVENMFLHHPWPVAILFRRYLFLPGIFDVSRDIEISVDTLTTLRIVVNMSKNAKEIDRVVYYYRQQRDSVCHTFVTTEKYVLRVSKLFLSEVGKISKPSNRERLSFVLSRYFCMGVASLIAYGSPIKFPHRLATLMRRGAKSAPRDFFIYLCLRFSCPGVACTTARIYHFLHGRKFDAKGKRLLE